MTRYRYDVMLGKRDPDSARPIDTTPTLVSDEAELRQWLAGSAQGSALWRGVPNARLASDVAIHHEIAHAPDDGRLGRSGTGAALERSYDPADLADLAAAHGLRCVCVAPPNAEEGRFDAWFGTGLPSGAPDSAARGDEASHPLLNHTLRRLSVELYNQLSELLPEAAMPASILPIGGSNWPGLPHSWSRYLVSGEF